MRKLAVFLLSLAILSTAGCNTTPAQELALPEPLRTRGDVMQFMLADDASEHPYTDGYKCGKFARDVVENAREQGVEAYRVIVEFKESSSHAIVLFPTLTGDVYVDSTCGDWWVEIIDGQYYSWSMVDDNVHSWYNVSVSDYFVDERL